MKNTKTQTQESRTPILDSYRTVFKSIPERPEVRRLIWRSRRTIYINLAARPDAKIEQLLP